MWGSRVPVKIRRLRKGSSSLLYIVSSPDPSAVRTEHGSPDGPRFWGEIVSWKIVLCLPCEFSALTPVKLLPQTYVSTLVPLPLPLRGVRSLSTFGDGGVRTSLDKVLITLRHRYLFPQISLTPETISFHTTSTYLSRVFSWSPETRRRIPVWCLPERLPCSESLTDTDIGLGRRVGGPRVNGRQTEG